MGTKIHGANPGFDFHWNAVAMCVDKLDIAMKRNVSDARTNCGNDKVGGANEYGLSSGGGLEFGTGSTEATAFAAMTAATQAWYAIPKATTVATDNPKYSGSALAESFTINLTATGVIGHSFAAQGTDSSGMPTRTTS